MANEVLVKNGTPIVWADIAGDFGDSPLAGTVQITLVSVAAGAARQGVKVDLLAARATRFAVTLRVEYDVAPVSGNVCSLWWAASESGTAGVANPGGASGADAAYTGTAGDSLVDSIKQCDLIGALVCTSDAAVVVNQQTWIYEPSTRYGSPIVYNEASQAFEGDDIEMSIIFTPLIDEIQ